MDKHSHWIQGEPVEGRGVTLLSSCPVAGEVLWRGFEAGAAEVDAACAAARGAFRDWSRRPLAARIEVLQRYKDALNRAAEPLATQISRAVGKPLWEARTEVATMVNKIDVSVQAYHQRTGERRTEAADGTSLLSHRPHGVMAVLGPYNFPGHLPNGHIVPALLAGNAVVFKPSEYAPQVGLTMAECWHRAGLPPGVLNVVNGGRATGATLVEHPEVDGVLFTGSYAGGAAISARLAGRPEKLLALEMGGNNPLVVWNVEDLDAAVHHIIMSAYVSAGQRCTCARRLIVPDDQRGEALLGRLVDVARQIGVGAWDAEPQPFMGPVVSVRVAAELLARQQGLLAGGAVALLEMGSIAPGTALLSPGVLDVTGVAELPDEEIFGPLLQVQRVADFDAALAAANRTRYGLAAGLLSDDPALWERFWGEVRAGVVNWNKPTTGASSAAPFGGVGRSGNHRPSAWYAADYCAWPVAGMTAPRAVLPAKTSPGLPFR
ncbi:succinylglutamate-semialdehyde dehydrogenase [Aquabacterium sp. A7-Y]|uniref:succinylglutamate-semialdehyde dehydrogenase n=1 Tax=Aquabacterium sp. A7-Y TaxID=1349605 RepID=UPI00223E2AA2|nr:succinylglutamate-semialdehyde dehydrogenase [Aquabacterium sp. A7-Y]MCW7539758.1 succinylglutamate-semialdehyde dehydrogenase [Aquabacterium sp. A7-Y]